jgi:hypothetical protein
MISHYGLNVARLPFRQERVRIRRRPKPLDEPLVLPFGVLDSNQRFLLLEPERGIEPRTTTIPRWCSTTELSRQLNWVPGISCARNPGGRTSHSTLLVKAGTPCGDRVTQTGARWRNQTPDISHTKGAFCH